MHLRLVNQLALLLGAAVLFTTLLLGGAVAWNLSAGFNDYLRAQDEDWLQRFSEMAGAAIERDGMAAIQGPPGKLRFLLDQVRGGRPDAAEASPFDRPPPRPGGPGGDVRQYGQRVSVRLPDGTPLAGQRNPAGPNDLQRPIHARGQRVAVAWLREARPAGSSINDAFLRRQFIGLLAAGLGAALLAALAAVWVARRWVKPLVLVQKATRRIAGGEFDVRLNPARSGGSQELRALANDLNAMAQGLANLEGSRRRWVAELSHELRTPLTVLRAEVEALLDGLRQPDVAALRSLHDEVQRLTRLADDFHLLALSDLRALPVRPTAVDVAALLQHEVQRRQDGFAARGLTLDLSVQPGLPEAAWDEDRMTQLVDNLLSNSLRYTDSPGQVRVSLQSAAAQPALVITVEDSAPSMPAHELPRVFEPLYRAEASRSRASGGSGLGLSICRAIVVGHGGSIQAAPSHLGGLKVTVSLPLQVEPSPREAAR